MKSHAPRGLNRQKMRDLYADKYCIEAIARKFKCRTNAVMHQVYDLTIPCIKMVRGNSKLTKEQVIVIRKLYIEDKESAPSISKKFNVSESTILNIIHGIFYRWVPGEVINKDGKIYKIPKRFYVDKIMNKKGAKKSGPNKKTERMVNAGVLIPIAKKHKVATCTISRWMRNGKMDTSGKLIKKSKVG